MAQHIRAIDAGGSGFRRADISGAIIENFKEIGSVADVNQLLDFVCSDLPVATEGIVYAIAGIVENNNVVVKAPNIHLLEGKPLGHLTHLRAKIPTMVYNDIEAAVMGMARLIPELPPYFMGITWSSGIGLRIFKEGYILADSEGGHTPLDPSPYAPLCGCGVRGCAESILSGRAIIHRVKAETEALGIPVPEGLHPCKFLDQCFDNGEQWAIDIYDLITSGMGAFLANIQMIFHLPAIVWKGTFAECAFKRRGIERSIREKMRRKLINPTWEEEMKFFFSPKPKHDALIGAASMMSEGLSRAS